MKITKVIINKVTKQVEGIVTDVPSYFTTIEAHHHLIICPGSIQSGEYPFPIVIPIQNRKGTKFIRTVPTKNTCDNLKP